jgi:aconitate hydratase
MNPEGFKEIKDARPLLILGDMVTYRSYFSSGKYPKRKPNWRIFYGTSNTSKRL